MTGMTLQSFFSAVLNMSITASYVILILCVLRLGMKKLPKKYSYALWAVALFRLVCPFSISSAFSVLRLSSASAPAANAPAGSISYIPQPVRPAAVGGITPQVPNTGAMAGAAQNQAGQIAESAGAGQNALSIAAAVWIIGITVILAYSVISYIRLKGRISTAVRLYDNVYVSDYVETPFVCGLARPKIYLPVDINPGEAGHILAHEKTHIKRRDYLIKPIAFGVLTLHWFNPLVWLAFKLMSYDMEMSCDERVLNSRENGDRVLYSSSLLSMASDRTVYSGSPIAFGETGVKRRISNILSYRKPGKTVALIATIVCIAVFTACALNPAGGENSGSPDPANASETVPPDYKPVIRDENGEIIELPIFLNGEYEYIPVEPLLCVADVIGTPNSAASITLSMDSNTYTKNNAPDYIRFTAYEDERPVAYMELACFADDEAANKYQNGDGSLEAAFEYFGTMELTGSGSFPETGAVSMAIVIFADTSSETGRSHAAKLEAMSKTISVNGIPVFAYNIAHDIDVPAPVIEAARLRVTSWFISDYREHPEYHYADWRIEALSNVYNYDDLGGLNLQIYQMDYQLLAQSPENVVLAGGMQITEDGWVTPTYPGCTWLVFMEDGDELMFLSSMMINDCSPGDPPFTTDLINLLSELELYPYKGLTNIEAILRASGVDGAAADSLGNDLYWRFMASPDEFLSDMGQCEYMSASLASMLIAGEVVMGEKYDQFEKTIRNLKETYSEAFSATASDLYSQVLNRESMLLSLESIYLYMINPDKYEFTDEDIIQAIEAANEHRKDWDLPPANWQFSYHDPNGMFMQMTPNNGSEGTMIVLTNADSPDPLNPEITMLIRDGVGSQWYVRDIQTG